MGYTRTFPKSPLPWSLMLGIQRLSHAGTRRGCRQHLGKACLALNVDNMPSLLRVVWDVVGYTRSNGVELVCPKMKRKSAGRELSAFVRTCPYLCRQCAGTSSVTRCREAHGKHPSPSCGVRTVMFIDCCRPYSTVVKYVSTQGDTWRFTVSGDVIGSEPPGMNVAPLVSDGGYCTRRRVPFPQRLMRSTKPNLTQIRHRRYAHMTLESLLKIAGAHTAASRQRGQR
jgi:hypothetical protein